MNLVEYALALLVFAVLLWIIVAIARLPKRVACTRCGLPKSIACWRVDCPYHEPDRFPGAR